MSLNLQIWKSRKDAKKAPEGTVFLRLVDSDNGVDVEAVDVEGNHVDGGFLIELKNTGRIHRYAHVCNGLGFKLNDTGQIKKSKFG